MLIELQGWQLILINSLVIGGVNLLLAFSLVKINDRHFQGGNFIFKIRTFEAGGRLYKKILFVHLWKKFLPDAGQNLNLGFKKKHLSGDDQKTLSKYLLETKRAEAAHLLNFLFLPVYLIWNPWWGFLLSFAVLFLLNFPCIVVQRYNRIRFARIIDKFYTEQQTSAK